MCQRQVAVGRQEIPAASPVEASFATPQIGIAYGSQGSNMFLPMLET